MSAPHPAPRFSERWSEFLRREPRKADDRFCELDDCQSHRLKKPVVKILLSVKDSSNVVESVDVNLQLASCHGRKPTANVEVTA